MCVSKVCMLLTYSMYMSQSFLPSFKFFVSLVSEGLFWSLLVMCYVFLISHWFKTCELIIVQLKSLVFMMVVVIICKEGRYWSYMHSWEVTIKYFVQNRRTKGFKDPLNHLSIESLVKILVVANSPRSS